MKIKSFGYGLICIGAMVTGLFVGAFAQVGGNDWTPITGQQFTHTEEDGKTHTRTLFYSPSSVTKVGDIATITLDTVFTDGTPTRFYSVQVNCRTRQYTFAQYDISVSPAVLGERSGWNNYQDNSPAPAMHAIVCK